MGFCEGLCQSQLKKEKCNLRKKEERWREIGIEKEKNRKIYWENRLVNVIPTNKKKSGCP